MADEVDTALHCGRLRTALEDVFFAALEAARTLEAYPHTDKFNPATVVQATQIRVRDRYLNALEHLRAYEEAIARRLQQK